MSEEKQATSVSPSGIELIEKAILLLCATVAVFCWCVMSARILSDTHPIWDLASHMSWHSWQGVSIVLLVAVLGMRMRIGEHRTRWWHRFIMALPPWVYFTWVTLPWTVLPLEPNDPEAPGLKVLSWNIWIFNHNPEQIVELIRKNNSDVVAIIELGHEQEKVLKQLEVEYPYCAWHADHSARGLALLSRVPGTRFTKMDLADVGMPAIQADVPATENHGGYRILAVHTRSPGLRQRTLDRNKQLHGLAEWASLPGSPPIIVGDLNITPWSPPFARLLRNGGLKDSRRYRGVFASWPTDLGTLGIPIDHALVGEGTQILFRSVGENAPDSDHRPISLIVK